MPDTPRSSGGTVPPPSSPPPPPPTGGGQAGITQWVRDHKALSIGGGVALLFGVFLFARWRSSKTGTSTSSSTTDTGGSGSTPSVYELNPAFGYGAYNSGEFADQLQQIEQQLSGSTTAAGSTSPPVPGAVQGQGGTWWLGLHNPQEAAAEAAQGYQIGYSAAAINPNGPNFFTITEWPPKNAPRGNVTYYFQLPSNTGAAPGSAQANLV